MPDKLDQLARDAGAMVLGEPGTTQQYLMTLEQIAEMVRLAAVDKLPPCPVPLPA